ncbi:MAG: carbonic anhydrase/acetyltransferase-like protein (isoleucine patch superfamily) [Bacteroidia bacterium]|jgi:carbonic anhydrase/acetyltransferase-like protein (isoleucine patch superfamily)
MAIIKTFRDNTPDINEDAFIAENATIIGDVKIGKKASIWYGAVLRGDSDKITIGANSNIQDNAVIHVDPGFPVKIGKDCIVGHLALVHGASIEDNVLVGMNATVLNGAQIGSYSIIGANALVTANTVIPPRSLVLGSPAKVVKQISDDQVAHIVRNAEAYVKLSQEYLEAELSG